MKRTIAIILIMMIISIQTVIYAADPSYSIELVPNKTDVTLGEEVEIILKVKDIQNIPEGLYAYHATIEYDTAIFEAITDKNVTGEGTWSLPLFNPTNGQLTAEVNSRDGVKTDSNIFKIKLKVKDNAVIGAKPQVKVTKFEASQGEETITAKKDAVISLNVVAKSNNPSDNNGGTSGSGTGNNNTGNNNGGAGTNNSNNGNGETSGTNNSNSGSNNGGAGTNNPSNSSGGTSNSKPSSTNGGSSSSKNNNTNNVSNKKLPQTGEADWIYVAGIAVIIIGAVSYIKYRRTY